MLRLVVLYETAGVLGGAVVPPFRPAEVMSDSAERGVWTVVGGLFGWAESPKLRDVGESTRGILDGESGVPSSAD